MIIQAPEKSDNSCEGCIYYTADDEWKNRDCKTVYGCKEGFIFVEEKEDD